jgi:hypothetical protein
MNENKQEKPEEKSTYSTTDKKPNKDVLKRVIIGLVVFAVVCLIFWIGIFIGGMKARFSYRWAESYHKNFAGPRGGFLDDWRSFPRGDFISSHGIFGQIIKIEESAIIIKDGNNMERIVAVKDGTIIERLRETVKISDLKIDDYIVVIGEPNDSGQIEAKFIRLLPTLPSKGSLMPLPPHIF